jgi:hypothetical protein
LGLDRAVRSKLVWADRQNADGKNLVESIAFFKFYVPVMESLTVYPQSTKPNRLIVGGSTPNKTVTITIPRGDARRAAKALKARAEWLERRRETDTVVRDMHRKEAGHSRRLAALILEGVE